MERTAHGSVEKSSRLRDPRTSPHRSLQLATLLRAALGRTIKVSFAMRRAVTLPLAFEFLAFSIPEIEVMLTIKNTNLTLLIPDESIAALRQSKPFSPTLKIGGSWVSRLILLVLIGAQAASGSMTTGVFLYS